jgi:branched-chain amino acid transport system substrate-binding protein
MAARMASRRLVLAAVALALSMTSAFAQQKYSDGVVKLGVLTDFSGVYSDFSGEGSNIAVRMAVEDFGGKVNGVPIEVISADHQNKADIGSAKAREWYDSQKVDIIFDTTNSAVTLAVMAIAEQANKIVIIGGSSTTKVTNENCTPNSIQYVYDANSLSNVVAKSILKQGGDTWYFVTVDFAFGHGLEKSTSDVVKAAGGKVIGAVRHPLNASDMSSFLLQAQSSGAKVIGLATAGGDLINAIKTAKQFGITSRDSKQRLASLLVFISDVHAMGLETAQGLYLTESFYWDLNDDTRKWSRRFFERHKKMPTMVQAAMYSAAMHYLEAVRDSRTDETKTVMAKMKSTPVHDFFAKNGHIREDGLHVHDMYLMQVKRPDESKYPWDYYNVKATVAPEEAFKSMAEGSCKFVKK